MIREFLDRRGRLLALALTAVTVVSSCGSSDVTAPTADARVSSPTPGLSIGPLPQPGSAKVTLQGAGATFPAPLYSVWFDRFTGQYGNVLFNYQPNGSGAGITAITQGTVDFGASDAAMQDSEIAALPAGVKLLHVPTALGAVVVIFNVPGVTDLSLDSQTIADIFLGTITMWNDPKLVALNSGVTLPAASIEVVHRSDGSGTTNAFTTYLDTLSPEWHSKVGAGKSVNWPTGTGAPGNDGVAGAVLNPPTESAGTIGYVELNYATTTKLSSAKIKNAAGKFVGGSTDGVTDAANAAVGTFPADLRQAPIINGPGDTTYPIASYTYLLVPVEWKNPDQAKAMVAFLAWALNYGQGLEQTLGYAPLPAAVRVKAEAEVHKITSGGTPVWP